MTIALSANTPRISYTVSQGVTRTDPYPIPFVFFTASSDVKVFVDGTERAFNASTANTTQFTVTGGSGSTGTMTTSVTGATGGSTVLITRSVPLARTVDFPSSGAFEVAKLNTELDTLFAIQSDFNDDASRSVRLKDSDSAADMTLPVLDTRKGKVLGFHSSSGIPEAVSQLTAAAVTVSTVSVGGSATASVSTSGNTATFALGIPTGATGATGAAGSDGDMTSFTVAGSSGSNQTITNGNTLTIAAGAGITTTGSATDTITIACTLDDPTAIAIALG